MRRFATAPLLAAALLAHTCAGATTFLVNVGGSALAFSPKTLTISAGDTVTFHNKGGTHNVAANDGSFRCAHGCDGSGGNGTPSTNWTVSVRFDTPRTIGYFCETHGSPGNGMYGTIIVQPTFPVRLQTFEVN